MVLMAHSSGLVDFPFNGLWRLKEGDLFRVYYCGRVYVYAWESGFVVGQEETWILEGSDYPLMTIFVCCNEEGRPSPTLHPPYRYVVRARLVRPGCCIPWIVRPGELYPGESLPGAAARAVTAGIR
jgi:sortase (surface protein transpeptidase)